MNYFSPDSTKGPRQGALIRFLRAYPHAKLVLLVPVYLLFFFAAERFVSPDKEYWISYMALDDRIPFLEGFILPYICWYPFLISIGLALMILDGPAFRRYIIFLMAGFFSALLFCVLVPNGQNLRPEVYPRQNFCTWLVGLIYAADTNTNVFPSMHVIGSIGGILAVHDCKRLKRWRLPVIFAGVLISLSTVFVKQHSFLDVIGGVIWSLPLWFLVYRLPKLRKRKAKNAAC